jgi:hypothetical protein
MSKLQRASALGRHAQENPAVSATRRLALFPFAAANRYEISRPNLPGRSSCIPHVNGNVVVITTRAPETWPLYPRRRLRN